MTMMAKVAPGIPERAVAAVNRLRVLHDEQALLKAVAFGCDAIAPLAELLNEREPSGIYQPRCRGATALGMIGAFDVLRDFLSRPRAIDEPIERAGEDAAVNAAARAVARSGDELTFNLLREISGQRPHLTGAVEALGSFARAEAVPELVGALAEDCSRSAAEAALARIGTGTIAALLEAATNRPPEGELEYSIGARKRRSAVKLLGEIGIDQRDWRRLRPLMADPDKWISALACGLALRVGTAPEQEEAYERLEALRRTADIWLLMHINDLLGQERPAAEEGDGP